jgi:hypothetical protein
MGRIVLFAQYRPQISIAMGANDRDNSIPNGFAGIDGVYIAGSQDGNGAGNFFEVADWMN